MKPKVAFFNRGTWESGALPNVYAQGRRERIEQLADVYPHVVSGANFTEHAENLRGIQAIFSTWNMQALSAEQLSAMPALQVVFYAAGSVKYFADPFVTAGVKIVSAAAANAIPVAEFVASHIQLSLKGYFRCRRELAMRHDWRSAHAMVGRGAYGEAVALIGTGVIGRLVIERLKGLNVRVLAVDPYLPSDDASQLGVEVVTLAEAFRGAMVVSNHLPNLAELRGVLNGELFSSMRQGGTFINTGRGAQVNEAELAEVLRDRDDLTALLDVTDPEPPAADSPLYTLPNVLLTPHIAGSAGDEVLRLADFVIDDFGRWLAGEPMRYVLDPAKLAQMA